MRGSISPEKKPTTEGARNDIFAGGQPLLGVSQFWVQVPTEFNLGQKSFHSHQCLIAAKLTGLSGALSSIPGTQSNLALPD